MIFWRKEIEEQEPLKFKNKRAERKWYDKLSKEPWNVIGDTLYFEKNPLIDYEWRVVNLTFKNNTFAKKSNMNTCNRAKEIQDDFNISDNTSSSIRKTGNENIE